MVDIIGIRTTLTSSDFLYRKLAWIEGTVTKCLSSFSTTKAPGNSLLGHQSDDANCLQSMLKFRAASLELIAFE